MVGNISGGHLNPIVSVAMAISGRLSMKELVPYILLKSRVDLLLLNYQNECN